ncbi:hypothetical protein BGZ47_005641 [Haplosporangium gracile]|nr:hypothetical protein BGZ47_005641 [Haplosporangium gracile]
MDATTQQRHIVAPEHEIPLLKILGVMGLCLSLIATVLYLGVQWIIRVGKAEHAAKQLPHQQQQQSNKKED